MERENGTAIYGRQPVLEALKARRRSMKRLCLADSVKPAPGMDELVNLARKQGIPVQSVRPQEFAKLAGDGHHQGVALEVGEYPYATLGEVLEFARVRAEDPFLLVLDHVQDPQNVGSLLRTAECAGVHGVILPADRAALITPAVVRASAGAGEHIRVVQVTNLVRTMEELKKDGLWFSGLEATPESKPFTEVDLRGPVGLVVGSEGKGLSRLVREHCDFLLALPMKGQVNSLNAGVAGAIAMYEIVRQRNLARPKGDERR
jgi:23S rRNA (guanosine2251-2'-O)-methyltransferase